MDGSAFWGDSPLAPPNLLNSEWEGARDKIESMTRRQRGLKANQGAGEDARLGGDEGQDGRHAADSGNALSIIQLKGISRFGLRVSRRLFDAACCSCVIYVFPVLLSGVEYRNGAIGPQQSGRIRLSHRSSGL